MSAMRRRGGLRIGILGSGRMGGKLGTIFARAGYRVVFSYARTDRKLKKLAREAGGDARAGTPAEAAREADVVRFSSRSSRMKGTAARSSRTASSISGSRRPASAGETGSRDESAG